MSAWGDCNLPRNSVKTLFLLFLAAIAALPALASDTTPPTLTSFTFTPMAVNTTTDSATGTVTAHLTDDLSGVNAAGVYFSSPSTEHSVGTSLALMSGTNLNGTFQGTMTVPAYSEAGTWTIGYVYVFDAVNNQNYYYTAFFNATASPDTFTLSLHPALPIPTLTSFTFTPMAVN